MPGTPIARRRLKALNDHVALARSSARRYRHDGGARGPGAGGGLLGAVARQLRAAAAQGADHLAQLRRDGAVPQLPGGPRHGNHWGDALALLVTSARSPYYFSLHASDPTDPDGGSRKDTGHTFICGPTGSGKTVFIGFLVAHAGASRA